MLAVCMISHSYFSNVDNWNCVLRF